MELTTIRELFKNREAYIDQKITVGGWVRSIRDSKTFGFIVVNDGSYWYIMMRWRILPRCRSSMWARRSS